MTVELEAPGFTVRPLEMDDVDAAAGILRYWMVNRHLGESVLVNDEFNSSVDQIVNSLGLDNINFWVATDNNTGNILGLSGVQPLSETLYRFANSNNPFEIINNYVRIGYLGKGIGRAILECVESVTIELGGSELFVVSGIRYQETSWKFYDRYFGPAICILENHYGDNAAASVWRKPFELHN